jgi:hypothetical protein
MTTSKSVPDGLNLQEFERSPVWNKTPFPYVPEKDTIQDTSSDRTMKIMLPKKVELRVTMFNQSSLGQFLSHVQTRPSGRRDCWQTMTRPARKIRRQRRSTLRPLMPAAATRYR